MIDNKKENSKLKVLAAPATYMLNDKYGSEESWSYNIMHNLKEFDVYFYSMVYGSDLSVKNNNMSIIGFTNEKKVRISIFNKFYFVIWYFIKSKKVLKEENIDIIHHILPFGFHQTFNILPLLGYTKNIPFIIGPLQSPLNYISDDDLGFSRGFFEMKPYFTSIFYKRIEFILLISFNKILKLLSIRTLENADALICNNEDAKKLYSQYVNSNKIHIITPGIDTKRFNFLERNGKGVVEVITVGYLIKRKGIDLIIKAFAKIIENNNKIILRIVGDGPQKENLLQLTKQLGLDKFLFFEGFVPNNEIAKYYQNADIFVSMSYSESFGQTLLESMATGLPVIATKIGGFKDIVIHGETGFLIGHDTDELEKYLIKLIDDIELRNIMGRNARKIVEEKYDWKIIAKKYYEIYHNLVSGL